jgi:hypothetical protein
MLTIKREVNNMILQKDREEGAGDGTSNMSVSQSAPPRLITSFYQGTHNASHAIQMHSRDLDIGNNEASGRASAAGGSGRGLGRCRGGLPELWKKQGAVEPSEAEMKKSGGDNHLPLLRHRSVTLLPRH